MAAYWTPGVMEYPTGVTGTGGYVYSEDQQSRLGVDALGNRMQLPARMQSHSAVPAPQPSLQRSLTPGYAVSLLSSPKVLASLCSQYFKKYDANQNGVLEVEELLQVAQEVRYSLGVPFETSEAELRASMAQCGAQADALSFEEFNTWFAQEMQRDVPASGGWASVPPDAIEVRVQAVGGGQATMKVPLKCSVGDFKAMACQELGLPSRGVRVLLGNRIFERDDGTLHEFGVQAGCLLTLIIAPLMVRRHVYKGRCLAASDEVDLSPDARLKEQRHVIEPPECSEHSGPVNFRPELPVFAVPLCGAAPPKKWDAAGDTLDWSQTAGEVFGDGMCDMVVLLMGAAGGPAY